MANRWKWNKEKFLFFALLLVCALLSCFFSYYTVLRHYRLESRDFDLGVLSNVIANTAKGHIFRSSYYGGESFLGVHVVPFYLFLAMLYGFFPFIETLLVLQSVVVVCAAVPLFLFARNLSISPGWALVVSLMYILNPGNHGALFYDFHELSLFPMMFFLYVLALSCGKMQASLFMLLACLFVKEDISILVLFALPMLSRFFERKQLGLHAGICVVWYILTVLIRSSFAAEAHRYVWYYQDLVAPGREGVVGLLLGIFGNPLYLFESRISLARGLYVVQLMAPLAFVPLLSWRLLLSVLPGFALTLMSSDRKWELYSISFQYVWYIVPAAFVAFALFTARVETVKLRRIIFSAALLFSLLLSYRYGCLLRREGFVGGYRKVRFDINSEELASRERLRALGRRIPAEEWVVCSSDLCAQLHEHINVMPCRAWNSRKDTFIQWAFVSDDRNCSSKSLEREKFVRRENEGPFSLWERDFNADYTESHNQP